MKSVLFVSALVLIFTGCSTTTFIKNAQINSRVYEKYQDSSSTEKLFSEGKSNIANKGLMQLVKDENKSFYDYFILGNMLFISNKEASYVYMRKAEEIEPNNPFVIYERGIHEHRLGNYSKAAEYYKRFHKTSIGKNHPISWAYLTHCNLVLGQYKQAISSWAKADFHKHHVAIEKAMYQIFSTPDQQTIREKTIVEIENGNTSQLCNLVQIDSNWESDWWNYSKKKDYLDFDLKLAQNHLKPATTEKELFDLCLNSELMSDKDYMSKLESLGVWGNTKVLPASSAQVYAIASRLTSNKLVSSKDFLMAYEEQLKDRLIKYPQDKKTLDVLAFLYSDVGDTIKLKHIDEYGWKTVHLEEYAVSYLMGMDINDSNYDNTLNEAISDFPNNASLSKLFLIKNIAGTNRKLALARYGASQFANVKNHLYEKFRLNDYMYGFSQEINK
ncbi:MAG: hypothetical protein Q7S87_11005 [Agitococcus sp.]|nr:hypothetical protein [Agitococcus sp.]